MAAHAFGEQTQDERRKIWIAALMACIGGCVDAIGYLTLFQVFTAHMSGNTVASGIYIGRQDWGELLHRLYPIPIFVLGTMLGATLIEIALRHQARRAFTLTLCFEVVLLGTFLAWGHSLVRNGQLSTHGWQLYAMITLPSLAMGIQNASLRRLGGDTVHTTYITGAITNLAEEAVKYGFWLVEHLRDPTARRRLAMLRLSLRERSVTRVLLFGSIWLGYIAGAILGAVAHDRWSLTSLALPLGGLGFLIVWSLFRPLYPTPEAMRHIARPGEA